MAGPYIPGKIGGNQQVADRWSRYASDNSYHPTKSEKAGGAPEMQRSEGRMTSRVKTPCCGPIGTYPNSKADRNG